jgi:hypothetical protein
MHTFIFFIKQIAIYIFLFFIRKQEHFENFG